MSPNYVIFDLKKIYGANFSAYPKFLWQEAIFLGESYVLYFHRAKNS